MSAPNFPRSLDEKHLLMLRMFLAGQPASRVAARTGMTPASTKVQRARILHDDLLASCPPERPEDVRRAYQR